MAAQALHAGAVRGHCSVSHEEGNRDVQVYWNPVHSTSEILDPEKHPGLQGDQRCLLYTEKLLRTSREMEVQFTFQNSTGRTKSLRANAEAFWVQICKQ